jgi:lipopolysaccharide transport system permease protein
VTSACELVIKPRKGWEPVDWREIWRYRELLGILVWRDVKIRYKQTLLGGLWAVLQPLIATIIFGAVFARVTNMKGDGSPYPLFVFAGLIPWTFFANAIGIASNSLVGSEQMIRKIYFPRVLVPLGMILALGLDMLISLGFMAILMVYYRWPVSPALLWLPFMMFGTLVVATALGLVLSAWNVQYRDVKYVVPFATQMGFFLTPVLYPAGQAAPKLRTLLALNPMSGLVEGFRYALLGSPVSWTLVWSSSVMSLLFFVVALYVFRRMERTFADVI